MRDPLEVVLYDKAGEEVLRRSMAAVGRILPPGQSIVVYKNNSDGKGNSYGCHENYLMDRAVPFARIAHLITPHFVTRQIYTAPARWAPRRRAAAGRDVGFQLTQRADFFEEEIGLETTLSARSSTPATSPTPTRSVPAAPCDRRRRQPRRGGDLLEGGDDRARARAHRGRRLRRGRPGARQPGAGHPPGRLDPTLRPRSRWPTAARSPPSSIQWELYGLARKYAEERGLECLGDEAVGQMVLARWEEVLHGLETDPATVGRQLDWVAKLQLSRPTASVTACDWDDSRLAAVDLQYHDLRPERSLFARLDTERLVEPSRGAGRGHRAAPTHPGVLPGAVPEALGLVRGRANWDSLVFDLGTDPLRRVP